MKRTTETAPIMTAEMENTRADRPPRLNFLLVDDDDICQFIHRRILELSEWCGSAHAAQNGAQALDYLAKAARGSAPVPDVILLDLEMPVMNGIAFLREFDTLPCLYKRQIAIVLLTSSVSEQDKKLALSLGASLSLSKPLTAAALESGLGELFAGRLPAPRACTLLPFRK